MDDITSLMRSSKITNKELPWYILKDLDFICDCYSKGITDMNWEDMCYDDEYIDITYDVYKLIFETINSKLAIIKVDFIDEVLILSYIDYYVNQINECKLCNV
jgi:hypothetical protein